MHLHQKRRQCGLIGDCLLFRNYEHNAERIKTKYYQSGLRTCEEGVKMLDNLAEQFLKAEQRKSTQGVDYDVKDIVSSHKAMISHKKEIREDEGPPLQDRTEDKRLYSFHKKEIGKSAYVSKQKEPKRRMTEVDLLTESLKKVNIEEDYFGGDDFDDNDENINMENTQEEMHNKNIEDVINQSNRKVLQRIQLRKQLKREEQIESSGSEYPMTDYSSNSSSNQDVHDEYYQDEESLPKQFIYETMTNLPIPSQTSVNLSTNYQPSKLMFSPKKQRSKIKRLFINKKQIPRWAADREKLKQISEQQQKDEKFNPESLYGVCIIERLDTNVVFNNNQFFIRGSSARWNKHPYSSIK